MVPWLEILSEGIIFTSVVFSRVNFVLAGVYALLEQKIPHMK